MNNTMCLMPVCRPIVAPVWATHISLTLQGLTPKKPVCRLCRLVRGISANQKPHEMQLDAILGDRGDILPKSQEMPLFCGKYVSPGMRRQTGDRVNIRRTSL